MCVCIYIYIFIHIYVCVYLYIYISIPIYRLILSRALWGSWAQSLSESPISLITGNSLHSASMTFPEFQWADSSSC